MNQVSTRGQITIDREARKKLGIHPGMIAYQRVVAEHLEIVFLPAPHCRSLFGVFHEEAEQPRVLTGDELEEAVKEAVAVEQAQAWDDFD